MKKHGKILKAALKGEKTFRPPFWFMRQAGRYLPEYRDLRARHKDFLEFCYTPKAAAEATLQPIRRFGMDGAIIFSDILVVPQALGAEVWFEQGHGPKLTPVRTARELEKLSIGGLGKKLAPVYEALRLVKNELSQETALIGFAGAPWTLACYMIEGGGSKDFAQAKGLAAESRDFFSRLIELLAEGVIEHAGNQIEAGADIIQLFDSWAGLLSEQAYEEWSVAPAKKIVAALRARYPETPVIGFPRQAGTKLLSYATQTGVDGISFDNSVSLAWVKENLQPEVAVQGCLDPRLLAGDKNTMLAEAQRIVAALKDKGFVFNLGHGILPATPVENMQALCDYLKNVRY